MSRHEQAPETEATPNTHYDSIARHPAFGTVVLNKWTSSCSERLFGSDLGHHTGVTLVFKTAEPISRA